MSVRLLLLLLEIWKVRKGEALLFTLLLGFLWCLLGLLVSFDDDDDDNDDDVKAQILTVQLIFYILHMLKKYYIRLAKKYSQMLKFFACLSATHKF